MDQKDLLFTARVVLKKAVSRVENTAGDPNVRDLSLLRTCLDMEHILTTLKDNPPSLLPLCSSTVSCDGGLYGTMQYVMKMGMQTQTVTKVFESRHPYLSNTNEVIELIFPVCSHITVTFDKESKTEQTHDYLRFYKNKLKTEKCHPQIERFSGRNGSENFPGLGNRPSLIIEGNEAFVEVISYFYI